MTSTPLGKLVRLKDTDETISASDPDIRGRRVLDSDGNDLGKVDALLVDQQENKVRFFEVETGGFLGIGRDKSLLPVDVIVSIDDKDVHINQSAQSVSASPAYDPTLVLAPSHYEDIYQYYGQVPYWATGYQYPAYPGFFPGY